MKMVIDLQNVYTRNILGRTADWKTENYWVFPSVDSEIILFYPLLCCTSLLIHVQACVFFISSNFNFL